MRKVKRIILPLIAVFLSMITAFSASAASFDFGSLLGTSGSDPLRSFFTILNLITTKNDSPSYTETPLEQVEYSEAELSRRQAIVDLVNKDLNRIKTDKPGFSINSQKGLPGGDRDSVQGMVQQYSSVAESLFQLLFGKEKNPVDIDKMMDSVGVTSFFADAGTSRHERGLNCDYDVSVSGKSYVSMLEAKDVYSENPISKSRYNDSYDFKIYLQDAVNPGSDSAQAKVFDLFSEAKLYQTLSSMMPEIDQNVLMLRYVDCYIQGTVDKEGHITRYLTHYKVILQVDMSQLNTEDFGYDLTQYLETVNNKELYESEVIYYNFDWSERLFGDVNDDDRVTTSDARALLRIASRLDPISETAIQFGDMNDDGKITTSDARTLLRCVAGLEDFPERKAE